VLVRFDEDAMTVEIIRLRREHRKDFAWELVEN
jgi:hypothetical protein